jgi:hypothetical protein
MSISFTNTAPVAGGTIQATDISQMRTDLENKFSGGIVNADISTDAAISISKLDANYEHVMVPISLVGPTAGGFPASGAVAAFPLTNDSKGNWVVTHADWVCNDVGDELGTFALQYGQFVAGTWTSTTAIGSSVTIASSDSGANTAGQGSVSGVSSVTLTAASNKMIAIVATGASATTLTADPSYLTVVVQMRRQITTA